MEKKMISLRGLGMMILAGLMVVSMSACSSDDGPDQGGATSAKAVSVQPGVYMAEKVLKYFDVEITDASGATQRITTNNTEVVTKATFGVKTDLIGGTMVNFVQTNGDKLRLYKASSVTLTSFPASLSCKVKATPNGTKPSADETIPLLITPDVALTNDSKGNEWEHINVSGGIVRTAISGGDWDDFVNSGRSTVEHTVSLLFSSATQCSGSIN